MRYKISIAFCAVCMLFVSCSDDFLEPDFENGLVTSNFLKTEDHALQIVTATYDVLNYQGLYNLGLFFIGTTTSDITQELHGDASRIGLGTLELDQFTHSGTNTYTSEAWYACYKGIGTANIALDAIPAIEMDESLKARLIAEEKFLRALFYYNIVTIFGEAPLLTEPTSPEQLGNLTKATESEIYAQIVADLTDAAANLPDTYGAEDAGRATSGAANALLARTKLWTGDYTGAINASQAVLNSSAGYALVTDYASIFNGEAENSVESVLEVQMVLGRPGGAGGAFAAERSEASKSFLWGPSQAWSHWLQPNVDFATGYEAGDLRRDGSLVEHAVFNANPADRNADGEITAADEINIGGNQTGFSNLKYIPAINGINNLTNFNNFAVNVHVIRFGEVLLNYAEALNENGQTVEAATELNKVRTRAGLANTTASSQAELRQAILDERKVELAFEGHRFFDLKRAGQLQTVLGPLGFQAGKHEVFAIPTTEVDILGISQNPGY